MPLRGPINRFKDVAEDVQYQFIGDEHQFSFLATRIHESMTLDASFAAGARRRIPADTLDDLRGAGHLLLPPQDRRNGELLLHHRQHAIAGLYPRPRRQPRGRTSVS